MVPKVPKNPKIDPNTDYEMVQNGTKMAPKWRKMVQNIKIGLIWLENWITYWPQDGPNTTQ